MTTPSHDNGLRTNKQAMTRQLSVDQILRLTQRELVQFVQQNITHEDGTWNVSNIVDWEDVSQAKRDLLAAKLL